MTLVKQTTLMMILASFLIFICTFVISINYSKKYFSEQLIQKAQDTATALGLSMSSQPNKKTDPTTMLSKIDAVFDRGNFSSIFIRDTEGKILVKRYLQEYQHNIPNWFISLMHLNNMDGTALIMNGWQQVGEVVVKSDPTVAYLALWQTAKKLFVLFLLATILIIAISAAYIKYIFKSLNQIVKQAEDIGRKNLYTLDKLPKTQELLLLSRTMNSMVTKLKIFFNLQIKKIERLHAKSYKDSLTGKGNRRYFFEQFNQYLSEESYFLPGYLFLIGLSGLTQLNQSQGYQAGDQFLRDISEYFEDLFAQLHLFLFARLDGPSFAIVVLEDRKTIESLLNNIGQNIDLFLKRNDKIISCDIAVVKCNFSESSTMILAKADKMIQKTKKAGINNYIIETENNREPILNSEVWRQKIEAAIAKKEFVFYEQPVKSAKNIYHKECFIKLLSGQHEIEASYFFPIVDQYQLGCDIDQLVLQEILKINDFLPVAINLSRITVGDAKKQEEFLLLLKKVVKKERKVQFELSEAILTKNMILASSFVDELVKLGYQIGLDRVGGHLTSLNYLKKVNVSYLKLDGTLSMGIDKNQLKRDIVRHWVKAAKRLDLILIATAVESESQWRALKELGIIYFQGTYIQSPTLIKR